MTAYVVRITAQNANVPPVYLAGPMTLPNIKRADRFPTKAAAQAAADDFFWGNRVVEIVEV